jgi:hypothetical protein
MSRHTLAHLFIALLLLRAVASAAQQDVKVLVLNTYSGSSNLTRASAAGSIKSAPCAEPAPADANPPFREPRQAVPFCAYSSSSEVTSSPFRFTRTNAILTTNDGQDYRIVLYCQRQLSDCPKLADGEMYTGRMNKNAILDLSPSKPVWGPPKVDLRPDGRHKVSYTIFSPQKLRTTPHQ